MSLPIIIESITISNTGGTSSAVTYTLNVKDTVDSMVAITPVGSVVDDGQTILNAYDCEVTFTTFDADILSDARVQITGASIPASKARIVMNGVSGGQDVTIDNVRLHLVSPYNNVDSRNGYSVRGTVRTIGSPIVLS
jgi:hypothetical protein